MSNIPCPMEDSGAFDCAFDMSVKMSKRLVTNPDEILELLLADAAFTEAASKDDKGVYIMDADGSKRYITQLEMEDD